MFFECLGVTESLSVFIMHLELKTKKKIKHNIILTDVFFSVMFERTLSSRNSFKVLSDCKGLKYKGLELFPFLYFSLVLAYGYSHKSIC